METLAVVVFVLATVMTGLCVVWASKAGANDGSKAILPGIVATAFLAIATMTIMVAKPSLPDANAGPTEKYFYRVVLEEKTIKEKTMVIVKDSEGKFYFSHFEKPLRVREVLVVPEGKFQPLLEKQAQVKAGPQAETSTQSQVEAENPQK